MLRHEPVAAGTVGESAPPLRVLLVAFSARYALAQTLDELFAAVSRHADCRALLPTNYAGNIPEGSVLRVPCGAGKIDGMLASLNPLAHWKTIAAVRRARPDVIHVFSGEGYTWAVTMALTAFAARIPVVLTLHDPDPHPGNIFEKLNAVVRRPVLRLTRVVHLFAGQHAGRAAKMVPHARHVVIPHGSLAGQFLRHKRRCVKREDLVLFFGRIQHYKGIDVLLRAMPDLPATTRLAIAGPGELGAENQRMIGTLGDRVELHNTYLNDADVALLMQRASVLALPYRHATQSSVPAIAAAFGCRIVSTDLGNFTEEVPALGGLVVGAEDPAALAAGIRRALAAGLLPPVHPRTFDDLSEQFVELYHLSRLGTEAEQVAAEQGRAQ